MPTAKALLAAKIEAIRGGRSYRVFSRDIKNATGFYISHSALQEYENPEGPMPRPAYLEALAKFAGKPVSWLFEEEYTDRASDGYNIYRVDAPPGLSADSPQEDWAAFLADAITRSGVDLDDTGRRQIAEAAAAVVSTLARQKAASKKSPQAHEQDTGHKLEK